MAKKLHEDSFTGYYQDSYYVYRVDKLGISYIAKNLSGAGVSQPLIRWLFLIEQKAPAKASEYQILSTNFKKQL